MTNDNDTLFRKSIEVIKYGNFTDENNEKDVLKQILRLLVNRLRFLLRARSLTIIFYFLYFIYAAINNEWKQLVRHLAAELQLGNLMLSRLETAQTDETKTYCVSILAVLGMLHIVIDKAREAKREMRKYGGSFMIFGDAELEKEDNEVALRRKVELIYQYKQSFEEVENQQKEQIEIENQKHQENNNKNQRQIIQLKQEIQSREESDQIANTKSQENSSGQQLIKQDKVKDQEVGEKLIKLNKIVNQTDKLVEIRRYEVDALEQEARQKQNEVQELRKFTHQQSNKRDEQKDQQESDEERISSKINKKEKLKENDKEKQRKKEKEKEKEKEKKKQKEKQKEKEIQNEKEKELKRKNENIIQKITIDKKEELFEDKQSKEMKQETQLQKEKQEKVQGIEIDKEIQKKKQIENTKEQSVEILIDSNSISNIATQTQSYKFQPQISKFYAILNKLKNGGIAIVKDSEVIPQMISFNEMTNLKGVVFTVPQCSLYMNGIEIWKRSDNIDKISEQQLQLQQQSSTSQQQSLTQIPQTKIQDQDKWIRLNIQLDFETEERIAKFFIGKDIIEFAGVGIKKLPQDIKVVVMSQSPVKAYYVDNQERKGEEITQFIPWSI